jgi:hypothetical protein
MTREKRLTIAFCALLGLAALGEIGTPGASFGLNVLVSQAEARFGRPLTPVSVAGVGRRTVRRCAAGVYNC